MNIPVNLKYTKDHEWVNIDGDTATVGITAQKRIRDIVYVEVETLDQSLDKDAVLVPLKRLKQFLISSHCQVKLLHSMMHLKVL
jgi:glycine cleavage system H protein